MALANAFAIATIYLAVSIMAARRVLPTLSTTLAREFVLGGVTDLVRAMLFSAIITHIFDYPLTIIECFIGVQMFHVLTSSSTFVKNKSFLREDSIRLCYTIILLTLGVALWLTIEGGPL